MVVGLPPPTPDMPKPIKAYLIVNKETGIWESWHGILAYAKQNADLFDAMLTGKKPKNPWDTDSNDAVVFIGEKKTNEIFN